MGTKVHFFGMIVAIVIFFVFLNFVNKADNKGIRNQYNLPT
jgi:hypothetical protein